MTVLTFIAGLTFLVVGAELLVRGAAKLALRFGVSALVVGLTVVAFGTSSPEMAVSINSARSGNVDIAVGNVVGSNIFNVLFTLGICALATPLIISRQIIRQEVPIMIGATLLLVAFSADGSISRLDAAILAVLAVVYTVFLIRQSRRVVAANKAESEANSLSDLDAEGVSTTSTWDGKVQVQAALIVTGLVTLILGSRWLVSAATSFAESLGISDVVVGLTIVAAGTSMPEVATSVLATIRGHREIAVGNVIGSNIFNILVVVGFSGLVAPVPLAVADSIQRLDNWVMLAVAVACLPVFFTGTAIARWEGGLFLGYYVAYVAYLILDSENHDALSTYSNVMLLFVVPITIVTLAVVLLRALRTANPPIAAS
jgi:cation:H+ antiporter